MGKWYTVLSTGPLPCNDEYTAEEWDNLIPWTTKKCNHYWTHKGAMLNWWKCRHCNLLAYRQVDTIRADEQPTRIIPPAGPKIIL